MDQEEKNKRSAATTCCHHLANSTNKKNNVEDMRISITNTYKRGKKKHEQSTSN